MLTEAAAGGSAQREQPRTRKLLFAQSVPVVQDGDVGPQPSRARWVAIGPNDFVATGDRHQTRMKLLHSGVARLDVALRAEGDMNAGALPLDYSESSVLSDVVRFRDAQALFARRVTNLLGVKVDEDGRVVDFRVAQRRARSPREPWRTGLIGRGFPRELHRVQRILDRYTLPPGVSSDNACDCLHA